MLTQEAINSAYALTERLDASNILVTPALGSALYALVEATRTDNSYNTQLGDDYTPDVNGILVMANMVTDATGVCGHDEVLDTMTPMLADALRGHISFAKTVVAPAIDGLVDRVSQVLADMQPSTLLGYEVIVNESPKPLTNSAFETAVRKFEEIPIDNPVLGLNLPDMSGEALLEALKTGTSSIDNDVAEWAAGLDTSFLTNVWMTAFQQKPVDVYAVVVPSFRGLIENRETGVDAAMVIYLWANRLLDAPPEGTEMNLRSYENLMAEYRNQAGARLCREIDTIDRNSKTGTLIVSSYMNKIEVNGNVYNKWISNGGSNEILFGNSLKVPSLTNEGDLTEAGDRLKSDWNTYCSLIAVTEANNRFTTTKDILASCYREQLVDLDESEVRMVGSIEGAVKKFEEMLIDVNQTDIDNMYSLALRLICRSRFFYSNAEEILGGIERIKLASPELSVREAATVSVTEYAAGWLATQLVITDAA